MSDTDWVQTDAAKRIDLLIKLHHAITDEARAAARWHEAPIERQDLAQLALLARSIRREAFDRYVEAYRDALRWRDVT
jgi:hypothetical protein